MTAPLMTAPAPAATFSQGLGSLRGIAATLVVFYHGLMIARLGAIDDPHDLPVDWDAPWLVLQHVLLGLFNGSAAVIVFFVLSGTVLALSMRRGASLDGPELAAYYVRRAFRLAPLLVAVALVAALLHHVYFTGEEVAFATTWMNWHFRHEPGAREIAANVIGWSHSLNSPAWTIFIEICASILFPALFVLSRRRRWRWAVLAALAVAALLPLPLRGLHVFTVSFFAGALVPEVGEGLARRFFQLPRPARIAATLGVLAVMAWFQRVHAPAAFVDPVVVLVTTAGAAFLVAVVLFNPRGRLLAWRPFLFVGEVSYGLYLMHFLVLFVLAHAAAPLMEGPLAPPAAILVGLGFGLATFAVTLPLATLTYTLMERPLQDVGRTLAKAIKEARRPNLFPLARPQRS